MIKKVILLTIVASMFFSACQTCTKTGSEKKQDSVSVDNQNDNVATDISFEVIKNYFVNNSVEKLDNPKIETEDKFNEIFGMAPLIGDDGAPTEIDFSKQFVIAVVLAETEMLTTVDAVSLQKNDKNEIVFTYKVVVGEKQTYISRPYIAIVVDKSEKGKIILNEIN